MYEQQFDLLKLLPPTAAKKLLLKGDPHLCDIRTQPLKIGVCMSRSFNGVYVLYNAATWQIYTYINSLLDIYGRLVGDILLYRQFGPKSDVDRAINFPRIVDSLDRILVESIYIYSQRLSQAMRILSCWSHWVHPVPHDSNITLWIYHFEVCCKYMYWIIIFRHYEFNYMK